MVYYDTIAPILAMSKAPAQVRAELPHRAKEPDAQWLCRAQFVCVCVCVCARACVVVFSVWFPSLLPLFFMSKWLLCSVDDYIRPAFSFYGDYLSLGID